MKKFLFWLGVVFTLSILYWVVRAKAIKNSSIQTEQIKFSGNIDFNMDDFVNALGGKENIISSSNTINALKLELKDGSKVEKDNFNKFEVHGFIKNNNSLTMIIGNNAQAINDELKK